SASSHSTTSTESGPQPSPIWHHNLNFNGLTSDFDRSRSMVNISKKPMEDDEDEISPRSGRSSTQSTLRYTNNEEEFSALDEERADGAGETPGRRGGGGATLRRIGPVNRQMSDVSAISPRRMMKGRSPSAPSLGGRKLKRMDSTSTTMSQTSNNTSTSSIRGSVNSHVLASLSSGSPSSSSMGQRPDTSMSRQSRVVAVKPKTSVSSMGADRRSVSSAPKVRPDSEQSVMKEDEKNRLINLIN
ncbi:hypothetical protein PFISCL1PPCAC_7077, partial [Pristionchus fissidentatus]